MVYLCVSVVPCGLRAFPCAHASFFISFSCHRLCPFGSFLGIFLIDLQELFAYGDTGSWLGISVECIVSIVSFGFYECLLLLNSGSCFSLGIVAQGGC